MSRSSASLSKPHISNGERLALLSAAWLACLSFTCALTLADPDLWGHTLYGLRAIEQGVLTERVDPFSYTAANAEWTNHEWLTEYQFGWLWSRFGNWGLWFWRNAWMLTVFAVAAWSVKRSRASVPAAILLWVFSAECLSQFVVFIRPQLATFGLFAVTLVILRIYWDRRSGYAIWSLPVVMLAWVNLHGGFIAGLCLIGLFAAATAFRAIKDRECRRPLAHLAAVFVLSAAATLINPYGIGLHQMLWFHLGSEQLVREWQPLWAAVQSPIYYIPFGLILLSLPGWSRRNGIDALVLFCVGLQAVCHIRHVALLSIAVMVLLPAMMTISWRRLFQHLSRSWSRPERWKSRLLGVLAVIFALSVLGVRSGWNMWRQGIAPWDVAVETRSDVPGVPARALAFMERERLSGRLLTDYGWGQYAIWHLFPETRVAFDGRYRTVYPEEIEAQLVAFLKADGNTKTPLIDDHHTELILLPRQRGPHDYLDHRTDFRLVYADDQSRLYVRNSPRFADVIRRARNDGFSSPSVPTWQVFPGEPTR